MQTGPTQGVQALKQCNYAYKTPYNPCQSSEYNQNTYHTQALLGTVNRTVQASLRPPKVPTALSSLHQIPHQLVFSLARIYTQQHLKMHVAPAAICLS